MTSIAEFTIFTLIMMHFEAFDQQRNFENKSTRAICYAPFVNMMFDTWGTVRVCCQSVTHSLGNITQQRLSEIWSGEVARELRQQMIRYDLPNGCTTCASQLRSGNFSSSFSTNYDNYAIMEENPQWPQAMEFLLSNTCNLECVQCYGELSSSIRKNRDRLPPLPKVYADAFFDDLRAFLPHLRVVSFLGGEPFLSSENFRIWHMLIEDNLSPHCSIITNGTVYNQRVQRILDKLPFNISISLDGGTKETVERIRRNSHFERTLSNIRRFVEYTKHAGTQFRLSCCLMPQNHHDFLEFLKLAEQLDCRVDINIVNHPTQFSFNGLTTAELSRIVKAWEEMDQLARSTLGRHLRVWQEQFTRLQNLLESKIQHPPFFYFLPIHSLLAQTREEQSLPSDNTQVDDAPPNVLEDQVPERLVPGSDHSEFLQAWSGCDTIDIVYLDNRDIVTSSGTGLASIPASQIVGLSIAEILMQLREEFGMDAEVTHEMIRPGCIDRIVEHVQLYGRKTSIRWIATPRYEQEGKKVGSLLHSAVRNQ